MKRKAIPEVIHAWNATHSEDYGAILMPVMWETHSTPEMGGRPPDINNRQIVSSCDALIGAFWTRIGTHTGVAESGTVEEIEEMKDLEIFHSAQLSLLITRYHLEALERDKYVCASGGIDHPTLYCINQEGRDFLIKNRLI